jgi:pilus assembly protein CpaB
MGNRAGLLLLLALVSGSLAAFLAFTFIRSPAAPASVTAVRETVPVVVAARDMDVGTTLSATDVKVVEWPGASAPAGFASSPAEVVGLGVTVPIVMNEPILPMKLAGKELGAGIAMLIPDSMRAISVSVNDVSAVAGWIRPGTRVDMMVTLDGVRTEVEPVTQVVLQNVTVLGNDRSVSQQENGTAVAIAIVTLLVSPEDAERVANAATQGQLHFILRNSLDQDTVNTPGIRTSNLLRRMAGAVAPAPVRSAGPRPAAAPPPPPQRRSIEVYRGVEKTDVPRGGGE